MKTFKAILGALVTLILSAAVVAGSLWVHYQTFIQTPVAITGDRLVFEVQRGAGVQVVARQLVAAGVLQDPYALLALAYQTDRAGRLKAGEYEVRSGTTPPQLLDLLR
jgi:UPF0755 protein